jgi:hypothetical protein
MVMLGGRDMMYLIDVIDAVAAPNHERRWQDYARTLQARYDLRTAELFKVVSEPILQLD